MFPVVEAGNLLGCVRTREIRDVPREEWASRSVRELTIPVCDENSISPEAAATEALAKMNRSETSRLLVVENGDLVGVITLKDLLKYLSLKIELEPR
jgi:CBS domain-containing protein